MMFDVAEKAMAAAKVTPREVCSAQLNGRLGSHAVAHLFHHHVAVPALLRHFVCMQQGLLPQPISCMRAAAEPPLHSAAGICDSMSCRMLPLKQR